MRRKLGLHCVVEGCFEFKDTKRGRHCRRHRYLFDRYGSTDDPTRTRECEMCGKSFDTSKRVQRFCSAYCRDSWWNRERSTSDRAG